MTSSSMSPKPEEEGREAKNNKSNEKNLRDSQAVLKEELRQSIIAKRHARGEKQIQLEYEEPKQMELTPAELEKRERRREQNRRAAQRCRNKKRVTQRNVIQNYERVVEHNQELKKELEMLKRQLNGLKSTCRTHSASCPTFSNLNCELDDFIKTEPITDDELQDSEQDTSPSQLFYPSQLLLNQKKSATESTAVHNTNDSFDDCAWTHGENAISAQTATYDSNFFSYGEEFININQSQCDILRHHSTTGSVQKEILQNLSYNCMEQSLPSATMSQLSEVEKQICEGEEYISDSKRRQKEYGCVLSDYFRDTSQVPMSSCAASCPSAIGLKYSDIRSALLLSSSPCQVVPSVQSPRPPRTSCSTDVTRHRSFSGGSLSVSEPPLTIAGERRISSVSSDGSFYSDNRGNLYQEPMTVDNPDADDDVFLNNNSLETPQNSRTTTEIEIPRSIRQDSRLTGNSSDLWSLAADFLDSNRSDISGTRDSNNNISITEPDDVSLLLQISDDQLLFFPDLENEDLASDVFGSVI